MDLSVVIVTYRCLPFTRLCLQSLLWEKHSQQEVIVIDNNSGDGSPAIIQKEFPSVKIIENKTNIGFGAACNQGMALARGRYYLMLNPDTIVPENLTRLVVDFMDAHPGCGAMGVKMMDGTGLFLPESKRGIPSVWRAFCRFSGLTNLFPHSRFFSGYYLGHLSQNQIQEVEVLSGAFMVFNPAAIQKTGGFDEQFFMYGEDIDLSYRIKLAGYKVLYNPEIKIIHFKGESTIKNRHYVKTFYGAMYLFHQKYASYRPGTGFRLVKSFITLTGWIAQIKYRKPARNRQNNVPELKQSIPAVMVSYDRDGIEKTALINQTPVPIVSIDKLPASYKNNTICILALSLLTPKEALSCFIRLSGEGYSCNWIDQTNSWLYIGRPSHKQTMVVSVNVQICDYK